MLFLAMPSHAFDMKKLEGYWGSADPNGFLTVIRDGQMWQCKHKIDGPEVFYRRFKVIEDNPNSVLVFIQYKAIIDDKAVYAHTGKKTDDLVVHNDRSEFMRFYNSAAVSWPEIISESCYSSSFKIPMDLDIDRVSKNKILNLYHTSDCAKSLDHWAEYSLGSDMRLTKEIAGNYPPLCYAIAPDLISWATESENQTTRYQKPPQSSYPPLLRNP